MLNPAERMTAHQVLRHPWLSDNPSPLPPIPKEVFIHALDVQRECDARVKACRTEFDHTTCKLVNVAEPVKSQPQPPSPECPVAANKRVCM